MNCPNCGKEILDEDATFCTECGSTLELKPESKSSDLVLAAAILTMVSAAFSVSFGYIGLYNYIGLVDYYASLGMAFPSNYFAFLIFGIVDVIACAFAVAGAAFMLKRKFIILSMLGDILLLVSAFVTYFIADQNQLLTEPLVFSKISVIMLSILSIILVFKSRDEFA